MRETSLAFALSVTFHLCLAGLFLALSAGGHKVVKTVTVDFSLLDPLVRETGPVSGAGPASMKGSPRTREGAAPREGVATPETRRQPSPAEKGKMEVRDGQPATGRSAAPSDPAGEVPAKGEVRAADNRAEPGAGIFSAPGGTVKDGGTGPGNRGASGSGQEAGPGGKDFRYIRDMVMKNVRYPEKARKMGLEGKVLLSFTVLENGSTSDIKVVTGSGSKMLDESAREGVARTRMDRVVPYRTAVVLPVVYKLHRTEPGD